MESLIDRGILRLLQSKRYPMHERFGRAPFRILSLLTGSSYTNKSSPDHARANRVRHVCGMEVKGAASTHKREQAALGSL